MFKIQLLVPIVIITLIKIIIIIIIEMGAVGYRPVTLSFVAGYLKVTRVYFYTDSIVYA